MKQARNSDSHIPHDCKYEMDCIVGACKSSYPKYECSQICAALQILKASAYTSPNFSADSGAMFNKSDITDAIIENGFAYDVSPYKDLAWLRITDVGRKLLLDSVPKKQMEIAR